MFSKPTIPKGTRDFSAGEMLKRDYIFDTIKRIFRLYGYNPIETPAMENLSTLLGKYGEEGDRLLFRILDSGDFLSGISDDELSAREQNRLAMKLCSKGLRYDLTVPFARYVVQHRNEITFPFKRYQIQPVWRADRPQKGRYREFFQCDADVIGSDSLLNEYELVRIADDIFAGLGIATVIKINNRKVLSGLAGFIGEADRLTDITIAIDKIDKTGLDAVKEELLSKGISGSAVEKLEPVLTLAGNTGKKLDELEKILSDQETGMKGLEELRTLFGYIGGAPLWSDVEFDLTLARGLNYYTGAIIEVKSRDVAIGSIGGGGRYDNLTGVFGLEGISGVGISFGADRIYDVLEHLNLFGKVSSSGTRVLILNFGQNETANALRIFDQLKRSGIRSELYPDPVKLKKQMAYADVNKIPIVVMAGAEEIKNNQVTVKNMSTGEQTSMSTGEFESFVANDLKEKI
ncbi:MAG: histidine--tRNA ligase [Bacteroidales bacterium]|nr:histidine--tRNA ligase [Bacteroidales bacterium]